MCLRIDAILSGRQGYFLLPGVCFTRLAPATGFFLFEALSTPLAVFIMEVCVPLQWSVVVNARPKECLVQLWELK